MRLLLAGLWSRRGTNIAALVITLLATGAALLGPMYGRASAEHLLDKRIDARAPYTTGLAVSRPALDEATMRLPVGPAGYSAPQPETLISDAATTLRTGKIDRFWLPGRSWLRDPGGTIRFGGHALEVPLYWRHDMCQMAHIDGSCPSKAGEVLVQRTMAATLGVGIGDPVSLVYQDRFTRRDPKHPGRIGAEKVRARQQTFTVVGTYRITDPQSPRWFDLSRFTGLDNLVPPPAKGGGAVPTTPALLVAPASMTSQTFVGGVDRPIDRRAVNLDTMSAVENAVEGFRSKQLNAGSAEELLDVDVSTLFHEVRSEHTMLSRLMLAALAPFVVLALLLLYGLVAAAAQVRRPYVALAKLRGHSSWQVFRFALAEPYVVVAVGAPLGIGAAVLAAHLIARTWLTPGIPVVVDRVGALAVVAVILASLVASAAAAFAVIREPLAGALASSVRARPSSRWSLMLKSAVVAVAVASVVQLLTSGQNAGQLLALLAPLFIALATAVGGVFLLTLGSRWWLRRTQSRRGTAAYLASRRLARRQDLTRLMIPLLLAVSVITFAASTSATADDWRVSRAKAGVGAPRTFITDASPGRLLAVTRKVDPQGKYVAAAVLDPSGDDMERRAFVDTSRLSRVAAWDDSWSAVPLSELQRRVSPDLGHRLSFSGSTVTVHVSDMHLTSSEPDAKTALWLQYVDDNGEQTDVQLGLLGAKPHSSLTTHVERCASRCLVEQMYLSGDSSSVSAAQGALTISGVAIDGKKVDWGLTKAGAWRPARPFPVSLVDPPDVLEPGPHGLKVTVYLGQLPPGNGAPPVMLSGIARITPSITPDVVPTLVTDETHTVPAAARGSAIAIDYGKDVVAGTALSGEKVPMRVVGRVAALPGLGDVGSLSDLETSLVEFEPPTGVDVVVQLWAAKDTPAAVLAAIRGSGVTLTQPVSVSSTLQDLRSDAFSLGLRIFLLVGGATLLLAIFGVLASAITSSRWRSYEVASLRVVGMKQRNLVRASVLEYVVMLGFAVVLGIVSAYLALTLVLPSISLGTAMPHDPSAIYSIHWRIVAAVGVSLFALAAVIALAVSRRITKLGRPSTLRWAEQG